MVLVSTSQNDPSAPTCLSFSSQPPHWPPLWLIFGGSVPGAKVFLGVQKGFLKHFLHSCVVGKKFENAAILGSRGHLGPTKTRHVWQKWQENGLQPICLALQFEGMLIAGLADHFGGPNLSPQGPIVRHFRTRARFKTRGGVVGLFRAGFRDQKWQRNLIQAA